MMKLNTKAIIGTGAFAVLLMILGQNCQPNYVIKTTGGDEAQVAAGTTDPGATGPDATNPPAPGTPPDPGCLTAAGCAGTVPPIIKDFKCTRIIPITLSDPLDVPARAADGVCYSLKILDAISRSSSSKSQSLDQTVISRDHEGTGGLPMNTRHPYILGKSFVRLMMHDRRFIKLSGSGTEILPIKVDNFLLVGTFPDSPSRSANSSFYRAYGTADSTIPNTNHITFNSDAIVLQSFGPSGTSTITALDITNSIQPMTVYDLDVRALDCGSIRESSDVYLLFQ